MIAQIHQAGFDGPAFPEDGTLLGSSLLVVNQLPKVIEVITAYEVYDGRGQRLGSVRQVGQSRVKRTVRLVLPIDQLLTHRFDITDVEGGLVLHLLRPRKFLYTRVLVFDASGRHLGTVRQENIFWKIRFALEDQRGATIGHLRAENLRAWDFQVLDRSEHVVAEVFKSWEGWGRAALTRADHFVVRVERPLEEPLRSLTVATSLAVDLALKQDNRR